MMATITKDEAARRAARDVFEAKWIELEKAHQNHDPTTVKRIHDEAFTAAAKIKPSIERKNINPIPGALKVLAKRDKWKPPSTGNEASLPPPPSGTLSDIKTDEVKDVQPPPPPQEKLVTPVVPQKLPAASTPDQDYVRVTMPDGRVYDVPSKGLGSTQEAYDAAAEATKRIKQENQAKGRLITLPDGKKVRVIDESATREDEVKYSPEALAQALSLFANAAPDEKTKMVQQLNVRSTRGPDGFQERTVTDTSFDAFVEKIPISDLKRAMFAVFKSKYAYEGTIADFANECIEWFFKQKGMELEFVERTPNISDRRNMEIR